MDSFGNRLKEALKNAGYSQAKITKELNLSKNAITNYINGRLPKADILYNISKVLNVSMEWLVSGESESHNCVGSNETILHSNNVMELTEDEFTILTLYRQLSVKEQNKVEGILEEKLANEKLKHRTESSTCPTGEIDENVV